MNKIDVLKNGKKLECTNVFLDEHSTHINNSRAHTAHIIRNQSKILSTCKRESKMFIRTNGNQGVEKIHCIRNEIDFSRLRLNTEN